MPNESMAEYEQLKAVTTPLLKSAGLSIVAEEKHPDVFGSAYCEYKGKGLHYRIIWDGKDGCGYVQRMTEQGWRNLNTTIPEAGHNAFSSALTKIRIELVEQIALERI